MNDILGVICELPLSDVLLTDATGYNSEAIVKMIDSVLHYWLVFPDIVSYIVNYNFYPQLFLQDVLQWIDSLGTSGAITFIIIYILATVAFFPGAILTLGAGVLFGAVWGSIYVFIGATIGATCAFLVGRYLARNWVIGKIADQPNFQAIDRAVAQAGLKIVLLTRLSPVFPFNLLNYAFGITGVSFKDYVIGSVGMIPGTIMYVYIGYLVGNLALIGSQQPNNLTIQWVMRFIGLVATVGVTVYITYIAKRALDQEIEL